MLFVLCLIKGNNYDRIFDTNNSNNIFYTDILRIQSRPQKQWANIPVKPILRLDRIGLDNRFDLVIYSTRTKQ
jgi:hypothetical protein